ncbi:emrB/qacA family drug resistance transporter [Streptomyces sp. NL15-2K]|nr:MFS transporter [Kutzneria buriramensis]WKX09817.1 MFS transporter [Kutzneria buriramensis]GCB48646.1 emrB/qacA family drug resistance transporter [Streptomyces sp. NL15-2K]
MGDTRPDIRATAEPTTTGRRGAVVAALMLAMALAALDSTIVSTAVPQIVGDLGGFSIFSWLFSGYLLAVTVTLPLYGKLSDTFGRKPVLITGAALFLLGSLLCALAWNMGALIAFRIVQGLGGGALQGTVQTLAADLYPLKDRPKIQSKLSTVWAVSAVAGPGVGGVLAAYADWRWIFLVNLPIGAVALWLIVRYLHEPERDRGLGDPDRDTGLGDRDRDTGLEDRDRDTGLGDRDRDTGLGDRDRGRDTGLGDRDTASTRARVDWAGALAVFACGGVLLTALVQGGVAWPWLSAPSIALFGTGLALAAVVVLVERRAAEPIIPGWVWRRRTIAAVNLALGALGLLMVAPTVFLPTYAQSVLGLAPVTAGFVLSVWTLSWPVSAALSQHVYRRIGFRNTAMLGIGAATLILFAFPFLPYPGEAWQPTLLMLLLGAALGLFQLPLLVGVQSTVGWSERGTTTASVLFCRQTGQTAGAAIFGAVANGVLAARLGSASDLDSVTRALDAGTAPEATRRAIADAVHAVYLGASCAAAVAFLVLLVLAPRRFPVLKE